MYYNKFIHSFKSISQPFLLRMLILSLFIFHFIIYYLRFFYLFIYVHIHAPFNSTNHVFVYLFSSTEVNAQLKEREINSQIQQPFHFKEKKSNTFLKRIICVQAEISLKLT